MQRSSFLSPHYPTVIQPSTAKVKLIWRGAASPPNVLHETIMIEDKYTIVEVPARYHTVVTSYLVYVSELEVVGVVLARDTTLLVHGGVSHPESEILHRHGRLQVHAAPDNKRGGPAAKLHAPAAFKNVTHRTGKWLQKESQLGCAEEESVRA